MSYGGVYFKLANDLCLNDISDVANWATNPPLNIWSPIGPATNPFSGNFDGDGYTIRGLYIQQNEDCGLFSNVNNATISNLTIADSFVSGTENVGAFAGKDVAYSKFINCRNGANVICNSTGSFNDNVGGILGFGASSQLIDCYNEGRI